MFLEMMVGKIHRAMVTEANLNYVGSITIDKTLMLAAGILQHQRVQIVNNNNGERFETYVLAGKSDSGVICLNGAAARLAQTGDTVIIMAYGMMDKDEANSLAPKIVFVDEENHITSIGVEVHGNIDYDCWNVATGQKLFVAIFFYELLL